MTRLIDADALMVAVEGNPLTTDSLKEYVRCTVREQPTIDAEPVRHGKWFEYPIADGMNQCSECGVLRFGESNYCPNCGADMRGEE